MESSSELTQLTVSLTPRLVSVVKMNYANAGILSKLSLVSIKGQNLEKSLQETVKKWVQYRPEND
jgi:hypothetical protein